MRHLWTWLVWAPLLAADGNVLFVLKNAQSAPQALAAAKQELGAQGKELAIGREDVPLERVLQAKVLFLEHPSPALLQRLKQPVLEAMGKGMQVATDVPDIVGRAWQVELDAKTSRQLLPYFQNGGAENLKRMFLKAYIAAGGQWRGPLLGPVEVPKQGVYHPAAKELFPNLTAYLAWYRQAKPKQGALAVVTLFHSYLKNGDMRHIDALLAALEAKGLAAAAVVGWPHSAVESVFAAPPNDPMKVMLATTFSLARPEDKVVLERQNVHVIGIIVSPQSYAQWENNERGITPDRVSTALSEPERNGVTEPIVIATTESSAETGMGYTAPIAERIQMAAARARRWVALAEKPNRQKRLAMLYYNNPPGKGNLGASYLNLPPSIIMALQALREDGYSIPERLPTPEQMVRQLELVGRNIELWAPGELDRMVNQGNITLLPVKRYKQWLALLPTKFRQHLAKRWGDPESAELMTWRGPTGEKFFVIPGMKVGNVFLGPQLLRSSFAEYTNVQHSGTLPPHHGYVAAYLYYRHVLQVDAVVHMGRHGTLEWLPGKNAGQAGWDDSEVILDDLPNLNFYIMDGDGEAIQARRRAAAVDLSHLTPMLVKTGEEQRFAALRAALGNWSETKETAPALAAEHAQKALAEMKQLGLLAQLGLEGKAEEASLTAAERFLEQMEETAIPLGLQTLGAAPALERQQAGLQAFLESSFLPEELSKVKRYSAEWTSQLFAGESAKLPAGLTPVLREKAEKVLADAKEWLQRLRASPGRELLAMTRVLRGEFLPSGLVGDPLAVPDALPSGRNLHQGDPATMPTPAAWELGKKLGQQLLEQHRQQHGQYPERISMVLWQGETGRQQGALEAEALFLMGVRPEWNARGQVDRLVLLPEAELGRPRVNVVFTVSGLYRDGLADKIILLDRATRMAAAAGDNALSRMNRQVEAALVAKGIAAEEAKEMAAARVFSTAPGAYGFGLDKMVEQSRDKDEPETMAQLYLTKMNYAFTEKRWGANTPHLLKQQLQGNQVILHSRSSNLYGSVDNDDVYQWMGGLRIASEAAGAKPELLINNMRRRGGERLESARNFIATELNARNWNPQWIAEMQKEGYSGAREMTKALENLYGWQATAPESIDKSVWQKMYDVYVADEYKLGMKEFFQTANPGAKQSLVARLLEVDRQGTYHFHPADRAELVKEYVRLVTEHGVACAANVCGNRKLQKAVVEWATQLSQQQLLEEQQAQQFARNFAEAAQSPPTQAEPRPRAPTQRQARATSRQPLLTERPLKIFEVKQFALLASDYIARHLSLEWVGWWLLCATAAGGLGVWGNRRQQRSAQMISLQQRE